MNLTAGTKVAFRRVTVRARFSNGAAMKTAHVRCVSIPRYPGEEPWSRDVDWPENGAIQLFAPVNRRITIQLTDMYRRDLGGSYTATFEPGATPIIREFVVKL